MDSAQPAQSSGARASATATATIARVSTTREAIERQAALGEKRGRIFETSASIKRLENGAILVEYR
ncbi:MAG: hypothetical protein AAFX04_13900 [Pseudomonadota bacterium]